jgi:thymidylate kinase
MSQLILFEGLDQSGKSSIAKILAKRIGFSYFKNPSEKTQFFVDDNRVTWIIEGTYLFNLVEQGVINKVILDRHLPSEYAYSYAYGRKTDGAKIVEFDARLADLGAIIIYCYKDSYEQYEDWAVKQKDRAKIKEGFELYLEQTRIPYLKLNTTDQNLENQIDAITFFMRQQIYNGWYWPEGGSKE